MKSEDVQGENLSSPDEYDLLQFARTYFSEGESPVSVNDGNQEERVVSSSADGQSGTLPSRLNSEKQNDLLLDETVDLLKDAVEEATELLDTITISPATASHPLLGGTNPPGFSIFLPPVDHICPDTSVEMKASVPIQANHAPLHGPSSFRAIQPLQQQQAIPSSDSSASHFERATSYLAVIKQRFVDDPETFKQFLEILQTFQTHQQSVHQVLDQVCLLFRDHPDLLRGFAFFMPDEIQEQAQEQLDRAAEKAQQQTELRAKDSQEDGAAPRASLVAKIVSI